MDIPEWAPFCLPYTSGTTGKPKGVLLPHRSRTAGFYANAAEYGCFGPSDHFCAVTPMCHGAGFSFPMCSIYFGGKVEIMDGSDPVKLLQRFHEGDITGSFLVPTQFHDMLGQAPALLASLKGHNLKALLCNAAPLPTATKLKVINNFGDHVRHELYGSTEAGIVTNLRPEDQRRKEQCVGRAF